MDGKCTFFHPITAACAIVCLAAGWPAHGQHTYTPARPDRVITLPAALNEVSGLTDFDAQRVAMVHDEAGKVYVYNHTLNKIEFEQPFGPAGDFEGMSFDGSSLFVLRSDGRLTEWKKFSMITGKLQIENHVLTLPTADNEGLGHDPIGQQLLIAAKSKPTDKSERDLRYIYGVSLGQPRMKVHKAFVIDMAEYRTKASQLKDLVRKRTPKGKMRPLNLRPSSVAVHPVSGDIYVLSAEDFVWVVLGRDSKIKHIQPLSPDIYQKAEGITFYPDGTMLVANEAEGKKATLAVLKPKN